MFTVKAQDYFKTNLDALPYPRPWRNPSSRCTTHSAVLWWFLVSGHSVALLQFPRLAKSEVPAALGFYHMNNY